MISASNLKGGLRDRKIVVGGWISFAHPSITEIFANCGFDFIAIDMEHSTISLEQAQRIIAASQSYGVPCLPRPVSHSNDWIKPLLDSGANGLIAPMVNSGIDCKTLSSLIKFPPLGRRSFGVNRAHEYGRSFNEYVSNWNDDSVFIAQIETKEAVKEIDAILDNPLLDGVMIGPYDLSGSLGVPGETNHPLVLEAEKSILNACKKRSKACGTQLADFTEKTFGKTLERGYSFVFASSDLFVLNNWASSVTSILKGIRN